MCDEVEYRHSDSQAIGYLLEDAAVWAVGYFAGDFHAAVDWAWVHDEHIFFAPGQPLGCHAVELVIFSQRGEQPAAEAFELNPQHIYRVDFFEYVVQAVGDGAAHGGDFFPDFRIGTPGFQRGV